MDIATMLHTVLHCQLLYTFVDKKIWTGPPEVVKQLREFSKTVEDIKRQSDYPLLTPETQLDSRGDQHMADRERGICKLRPPIQEYHSCM